MLIPAVVAYVSQRGGWVTKTKLLKLLYLFDVEYYRLHRQTFTAFNWKYFHLGPWTAEYDPFIEELVVRGDLERTTSSRPDYDTTFFKATADCDLDKQFESYKDSFALRCILDAWAVRTTGEILDYVYFRTEPMEDAIRNERLDFSKIPGEQPVIYKRSSSGRYPRDIEKMRAEFNRRPDAQRTPPATRFEFTLPNYDEEYEKGISKLDELAR